MSISSCPHCAGHVLIPDGTPDTALVRCPLCNQQYVLGEAPGSPPPPLEVVHVPPASSGTSSFIPFTDSGLGHGMAAVGDCPPSDAWRPSEPPVADEPELDLPAEPVLDFPDESELAMPEEPELAFPAEPEPAEIGPADSPNATVEFDPLEMRDEPLDFSIAEPLDLPSDEPTAETPGEFSTLRFGEAPPPVDFDPIESETSPNESSPNETADWNTIKDLDAEPLELADENTSPNYAPAAAPFEEYRTPAPDDDPIEIADEGAFFDAPSEEEEPADASDEADFGDPIEVVEPVVAATASPKPGAAASVGAPSMQILTPPPKRKRRQPSALANLVGYVGGGVIALPLAYYIVLWIGGPDKDVLGIGPSIRWILPSSFSQPPAANSAQTTIAKKETVPPHEGQSWLEKEGGVNVGGTHANDHKSPAEEEAAKTAMDDASPTADDATPPDAPDTASDGAPVEDIQPGPESDPTNIDSPAPKPVDSAPDSPAEAPPTDAPPADEAPAPADEPVPDLPDPVPPTDDAPPADDIPPADEPAPDPADSPDLPPDLPAPDDAPPVDDIPPADDAPPSDEPAPEPSDAPPADPPADDVPPTDAPEEPVADVPPPELKTGLREPIDFDSQRVGEALQEVTTISAQIPNAGKLDKDQAKKLKLQFYFRCYDLAEAADFAGADATDASAMSQREEIEKLAQSLASNEAQAKMLGVAAGQWLELDPAKRNSRRGVLLVGSVDEINERGSLHEVVVTLSGSKKTARVLTAEKPSFGPSDQVVVLGRIIADPSKELVGYEGDADQKVWTNVAVKLP